MQEALENLVETVDIHDPVLFFLKTLVALDCELATHFLFYLFNNLAKTLELSP